MDQQLVIKLTSDDGKGVPVGLIESPPILYTNFKLLFPTISFSGKANSQETEPFWFGVFEWDYMPVDLPYNKSANDVGLTKQKDGVWRPTFEIRDATADEIKERTELKSILIRKQRDKLLRLSDFSQIADAPDNVKSNLNAWNKYRQDLRDLTNQKGFPWDVIFPQKP